VRINRFALLNMRLLARISAPDRPTLRHLQRYTFSLDRLELLVAQCEKWLHNRVGMS
jgi:hypothetical protein